MTMGTSHLRRAILLAVLALAVSPAGAGTAEPDPPPFQGRQKPFTVLRPAQETPASPLHTPTGGVTTLRRYRGTVTLVNLWATWCPACVHEIPALARLQESLGRDRLHVALVSVDDGGWAAVRPYLERLGVRGLDQYLDPAGRLAQALGAHEGLPWTFVVDPSGRVVGYVMGAAEWDGDAARALIDHYARPTPR